MTGGGPSLRVLLVEDNPGDARLVRETMAERGDALMHFTHRESLSAGVDALGDGAFDAVLLDLSLPDSHGLETVRRLRRASPTTPIVVMTSLNDEPTALQAVADGAQDYLIKGPDTDARILLRAVRHAIERQHAQEQLADAQRFEAMGRLAGAVAHEFNTLLATMLGCSGLLLDQVGDDPDLRDLATTLQESAKRAAMVTEQVLAVGGAKRLQPIGLPLNHAVDAAGGMLGRIMGAHRTVALSLDAEFDAVLFDPAEIEHLLAVLALAALETMPADGALTLGTGNTVLDDASARRLGLTPGLHVILTVHTDASGLSSQTIDTILEPSAMPVTAFARINGLSLAGVRSTLREAGARIVAGSDGAGMTFTIYFPHRSQEVQV